MTAAVGFILKGYPRLSETFIAQEILALERRGLDIRLFSLRQPTDRTAHPVHREIAAPVSYLPEYLHDQPRRVARAWRQVRGLPGYGAALTTWRRDLCRDLTASRVRRFGQALVLAAELPADVDWLHAHFLHTPASVTRYAALMRGLPWSASAHAKDIWTIPVWEKREKLACCRWLVTCSRVNAAHLAELAPEPARVGLSYHGLDFSRFPPPPLSAPGTRDGREASDPAVIVSIGRAVQKKGIDVLIEALSLIPLTVHWRLIHIGDGFLLAGLKRDAEAAGVSERITWLGACPQDRVLAALREADLFVLAAKVAADGDRDGLPNVLLEAQSQGLACVSTRVSAIPELIDDGQTGILVPPGEPGPLAEALTRLIGAPLLRRRLGRAGMRRVREDFSMETGIDRLATLFGLTGESPPCASHSTRR